MVKFENVEEKNLSLSTSHISFFHSFLCFVRPLYRSVLFLSFFLTFSLFVPPLSLPLLLCLSLCSPFRNGFLSYFHISFCPVLFFLLLRFLKSFNVFCFRFLTKITLPCVSTRHQRKSICLTVFAQP